MAKLVASFHTNQFGHRKYRLVKYINNSTPEDPGYVIEELLEDALGGQSWSRMSHFEPRSPVATLLHTYVDKQGVL